MEESGIPSGLSASVEEPGLPSDLSPSVEEPAFRPAFLQPQKRALAPVEKSPDQI